MSARIETGVERPAPVSVEIDGGIVPAFPGETILTVLMAHGRTALRLDTRGEPRGAWCNMGTCSECFVRVRLDGGARRVRACLTPIAVGMTIETGVDG